MNSEKKIAIYHWHQLIEQSCTYNGILLLDDLKNYLLLTLIRYIEDESLPREAIEFSHQLRDDMPLDPRPAVLKNQADHCLILAGLFPSHIDRQQQRISHYIQHGLLRYTQLATRNYDTDKRVYQGLADSFVSLVDVLISLKQINGSPSLPMLQAMELWSDTGSLTAYRTLTMNRASIPLSERFINDNLLH